jgi:hypothetical protein
MREERSRDRIFDYLQLPHDIQRGPIRVSNIPRSRATFIVTLIVTVSMITKPLRAQCGDDDDGSAFPLFSKGASDSAKVVATLYPPTSLMPCPPSFPSISHDACMRHDKRLTQVLKFEIRRGGIGLWLLHVRLRGERRAVVETLDAAEEELERAVAGTGRAPGVLLSVDARFRI